MRSRIRRRAWRAFRPWERHHIEARLAYGMEPACPRCGAVLEAQPATRLRAVLPPGAGGFDLDCRPCRRFLFKVWHTETSRRRLRLRRFAAAVLRA